MFKTQFFFHIYFSCFPHFFTCNLSKNNRLKRNCKKNTSGWAEFTSRSNEYKQVKNLAFNKKGFVYQIILQQIVSDLFKDRVGFC